MSRTLTAGMDAMLATATHSRCRMLRIELFDGTIYGFTDHDKTITFNLGDGAVTYSPAAGMFGSDVALREGFDVDNFEASGPLGTIITRLHVLGGRFNRAEARLFEVDWRNLANGAIKQLGGNIGDIQIKGGKFIFGIRGMIDRYNQTVGRVMSNLCSADHGDAQCTRVVETVAATVTAVTDAMRFNVSFVGSFPDDYFNLGKIVFNTGALAGIRPAPVFDWTAAGAVVLVEPLPDAPQIGDTMTIHRGCPKTRQACMDRGNIANARAFFEVPGTDQALRIPVPGNPGA